MAARNQAWPAFWLSLAAPGTGQLLARSWTAIAWFAAVVGVAAMFVPAAPNLGGTLPTPAWPLAQLVILLAIGIASAWHARWLCLGDCRQISKRGAASVRCCAVRGRAVRMSIRVATGLSADALWRRMRDLPTFLTIDPFHERVTLMRRVPAAGVHLVLDHNAFGIRLRRVGRILSWREGEGYDVSDLSLRGIRAGFPHVFSYRIERDADGTSALRVDIHGKWTSPIIPVWLGRLWLLAVCYDHAWQLQRNL